MNPQTVLNAPLAKAEFSGASELKPQSKQKKKRRAPLSVRLSDEQWQQFEADAIGMSFNAYALSCFFDKGTKSKAKKAKRDKAIASALRRMGSLGIGAFITCQILAYEEGRLTMSDDEIADFRRADIELHRLRCDLLKGLGLEPDYKK